MKNYKVIRDWHYLYKMEYIKGEGYVDRIARDPTECAKIIKYEKKVYAVDVTYHTHLNFSVFIVEIPSNFEGSWRDSSLKRKYVAIYDIYSLLELQNYLDNNCLNYI